MFSKAISLCPGNVFSSLSVFLHQRGKGLFFQRDYAAAQAFLEKALALYGQFDSFWRRPTMNSYLALTLVKKQEPVRRPTASSCRAEIYVADEEPQRPGFRLFLPGPDPRLGGPGSGGGPFLTSSCRIPRWTMDVWPLKHLSRWLDRPEINSLLRLFPEL